MKNLLLFVIHRYFINFNTILSTATKAMMAAANNPKVTSQSIPIILLNWLLLTRRTLDPKNPCQ